MSLNLFCLVNLGLWVSVSAQVKPFQEGFERCKPAIESEFITRYIKPSEVPDADMASFKDYPHYVIGTPNGMTPPSGNRQLGNARRKRRQNMQPKMMMGPKKMKSPKMKPKMMMTPRPMMTKRPTASPTAKPPPVLNVFLHGTGSAPYRHTCVLYAYARSGPTIGLQYNNLDNPDSKRNENCGLEPDAAQCLLDQHIQVLYGANIRPNLWGEITAIEAIVGRLGRLLKHLDTQYPGEGWVDYYMDDDEFPKPKWDCINISGHSQGSGHAAYIAQQEECAGAGLLSGPQDECIDCAAGTKLWLDEPFKTYGIAAFAHGDSRNEYEPSLPVQIENWTRMAKTGSISWPSDKPVVPKNIVEHLDGDYDFCDGPFVSTIAPSVNNTCGRAGHCSIALDKSAPYLMTSDGKQHFVYLENAWPKVNCGYKCEKPM